MWISNSVKFAFSMQRLCVVWATIKRCWISCHVMFDKSFWKRNKIRLVGVRSRRNNDVYPISLFDFRLNKISTISIIFLHVSSVVSFFLVGSSSQIERYFFLSTYICYDLTELMSRKSFLLWVSFHHILPGERRELDNKTIECSNKR